MRAERTEWTAIGAQVLFLVLFWSAQSGATTSYPDQSGAHFDFLGIEETSTSGDPEPLFPLIGRAEYEPGPDGERFLVLEDAERGRNIPATVVLNWSTLLENR